MKTLRFYLSLLVLAILVAGVVYAITPTDVNAYGNCSQLNICSIEYNCGEQCINPVGRVLYRDISYLVKGDCQYGCSEPMGCTQICVQ